MAEERIDLPDVHVGVLRQGQTIGVALPGQQLPRGALIGGQQPAQRRDRHLQPVQAGVGLGFGPQGFYERLAMDLLTRPYRQHVQQGSFHRFGRRFVHRAALDDEREPAQAAQPDGRRRDPAGVADITDDAAVTSGRHIAAGTGVDLCDLAGSK